MKQIYIKTILITILILTISAQSKATPGYYYQNSEFGFLKQLYYKTISRQQDLDDNKKLINQYLLAEENYDANYTSDAKIPKIIHHIWLGNNQLSPRFNFYIKTCQMLHPDWQHKIWSEQDLKDFDQGTTQLIAQAKSYPEQADILRLAILKKFGGVYLDADIICLKSFDNLVHRYNFIASIDYARRRLLNGIIASSPDHPLINSSISNLTENFQNKSNKFFNETYKSKDPVQSLHRLAINRTMLPLSDAVLKYDGLTNDKNLMILPLEYCMEPYKSDMIDQIKSFFGYYLDNNNGVVFNKFAQCFHSTNPKNSYFAFPKFSLAIGSHVGEIMPFIFGIFKSKEDYFNEFNYLYKKNYPAIIPFQQTSQINEKIHIIGNVPAKQWQNNFPHFQIKEWNQKQLDQLLEQNNLSNLVNNDEVRNTIAALIILKQEGGMVINDTLFPNNTEILELFYKYNLFLTLTPIKHYNDHLLISMKIMAAKQNQIFINKTLDHIKQHPYLIKSTDDISQILAKTIIQNLSLDLRTIIFPGSFFLSPNKQFTYSYRE